MTLVILSEFILGPNYSNIFIQNVKSNINNDTQFWNCILVLIVSELFRGGPEQTNGFLQTRLMGARLPKCSDAQPTIFQFSMQFCIALLDNLFRLA